MADQGVNQIWLPETETSVVIVDGRVYIKDEMKMKLKQVKKKIGFDDTNGDSVVEKSREVG